MQKFLIIGLGNIGDDYAYTRHNIGFLILDSFSLDKQISFRTEKLGSISDFKEKGRQIILIKPSTYVNLSGKALRYWMQKEKIPLERVLVVTDDIHLPFGKIRLRKNGSSAGHNGLKHIEETLNTTAYNRLKIGIGNQYPKGRQVDFVLGQWIEQETEELPIIFEKTRKGILNFCLLGMDKAMSLSN